MPRWLDRTSTGLILILVFSECLGWAAVPGPAQAPPPRTNVVGDLGQFTGWIQAEAGRLPRSLSFLAQPWPERTQWRVQARAKMDELLAYAPPACPLDSEVLDEVDRGSYRRLRVRYAVRPGQKVEAFLLLPRGLRGPVPAVVALHDHGGFYYFGKEKVTATEAPPRILREFIETAYGGRTYADELARRGWVVLVPDAFYFGSQRLDPAQLDPRWTRELEGVEAGSDEYIRRFNRMASAHETLTAKTLLTAGTTWPGVLFHGDRIALNYLMTRPEVDRERVGCMGLSIGGFRSAHLAGLDPRIRAAVVAGWMTTYDTLLQDHLRSHTWMIYVPGQLRYLDLPDVASLHAPRPLLVMQCLQDALFTLDGMRAAETRLRAVYGRMQSENQFDCRFYDVPHCLNVTMQDEAMAWLERALR